MDLRFVGIDWQHDFCSTDGALYVPGADEDAKRCSAMIKRLKRKITGMHFTMDCHQLVHIAHPIWWINSKGEHPTPFTIITIEDVEDGVWKTTNHALQQWSLHYVKELKNKGKYVLCIWPPHCLIGQKGNNIYDPIAETLTEWEALFRKVDYRVKGSNPYTEHYSAIEAEVTDSNDPTTQLQTGKGSLIQLLADADIVATTGQALSHCLANTIRSVVNNFGEENIKKLWLIKDCTSSVPGFEQLGEDFINEMVGRGMNITTSTEFLS